MLKCLRGGLVAATEPKGLSGLKDVIKRLLRPNGENSCAAVWLPRRHTLTPDARTSPRHDAYAAALLPRHHRSKGIHGRIACRDAHSKCQRGGSFIATSCGARLASPKPTCLLGDLVALTCASATTVAVENWPTPARRLGCRDSCLGHYLGPDKRTGPARRLRGRDMVSLVSRCHKESAKPARRVGCRDAELTAAPLPRPSDQEKIMVCRYLRGGVMPANQRCVRATSCLRAGQQRRDEKTLVRRYSLRAGRVRATRRWRRLEIVRVRR
jgi:hypothetical protein